MAMGYISFTVRDLGDTLFQKFRYGELCLIRNRNSDLTWD